MRPPDLEEPETRGSSSAAIAPAMGAPSHVLLHCGLLLLAALIATRSIWAPALLAGHSSWFDLTRMVEFDAAIRSGDLLPAWSPDFYFGYGSPLFQFYAPLAYYLTEIWVLIGLSFATALKVTQFLALFASGLAMYRLSVTYFSGWAACLGGLLYMVAPYRLVDIFVRHALAEHCAFIWLPLIIWGTERSVSQQSRAGLATGCMATAALILTHNIMALVGLPVCVAAGWVLAGPQRRISSGFLACRLALLGIGMAAFFWWPAMAGRPLIHADESLTGGYFDFHRHFVAPHRLIALDWGFGQSEDDAADRMSLQIGLPHLLTGLTALVLACFARRKKEENSMKIRWLLTSVGLLLGAVFMCSSLSLPLWQFLPLLKFTQFPWRFLGLAILGAAMCGTAVADRLEIQNSRRAPFILLGVFAVVLTAYFPYYSRVRFYAANARNHSAGLTSAATVDALDAAGLLIPVGLGITRDDIRAAGERATSKDDFLPHTVQQKPTHPPDALLLAGGHAVQRWTHPGLNSYRAELQMPVPILLELQQFWFPGWEATIDGQPVKITPSGPYPIVSCEVPPGNHTVQFDYRGLPERRIGIAVSTCALALTAMSVWLLGRSPHPREGGLA